MHSTLKADSMELVPILNEIWAPKRGGDALLLCSMDRLQKAGGQASQPQGDAAQTFSNR